MKTIDRLLWSDLRRTWRQCLAISVVLGCGVATFVMSGSTISSLTETCDRYYRDNAFADVFVSLTRAPRHLAKRLEALPGVDQVQTRVVRSVILDMPDMSEPASCRLVSLPADPREGLNRLHLRRGRLPSPDRRGEVVAGEPFAKAHRLSPGDSVPVIMGGRREELKIVGIGMSPEYIYAVEPGRILPDDRRFGVLWMPYRQMAAAFNMEGAFNDAALTLLPRAAANDVVFQVDRLTRRYGGQGAYLRGDQVSHRRVEDELHQLRGMAMVTPMIFLAVSAFLFNLVLSRMVRHQQEQIATLRAFGYTSGEVGRHYLKLTLILVACGFLLGAVAGVWLSHWMTQVYGKFFRFPVLYFRVAWGRNGIAALLALLAALAGGYSAIRRARRLPPAVAMRPEAPSSARASLVERLLPARMLTPISRLILRRLERNPVSTMLSISGMALGTAVLVLGSFMEDTIDFVIDAQFQRAQRQDVTLAFNEVISAGGLYDARRLPGVLDAEPFRAAPVKLWKGTRSRRVSLMGLDENPRLFRVLDQRQREVAFPGGGLTISTKLSEILQVAVGEELEVEVMEGRRLRRTVRVMSVFPDYADPGAYMNRRELHRLLREGECLSGVFLAVDPLRMDELQSALKQTPVAASVSLRSAAIQSFTDTVAENLRPMRMINAVFASIIAFGVMYNSALALAERSRDLATLRVFGYTRGEVSVVLLGELAFIALAALPLGLPIGYAMAYFATEALDTETHRFPLVVSRATFAYAAAMILLAAYTSCVLLRRMIDKLNLLAVLKVRE